MKENRSLKVIRVRYGLTQEEMAGKLSMSRQAYAKIENGQIYGSISFWSKVQHVFKISSEEMWNLINDEEESRAQV